MVRTVRRDRRYMVGPFERWIARKNFVRFFAPEGERRPLQSLDVSARKIERAYVDRVGRVWLLVSQVPYDVVKHFRGYPDVGRRLAALWGYRCYTDLYTELGRVPVCVVCGGVASFIVFWQDPSAVTATVGPCSVGRGAYLTCGFRRYYVGEVLSLFRDLVGRLYAKVLTFNQAQSQDSDVRLVEVEALPEIGWKRPLVTVV